jgi:hypothetical protein
MGVGEGLTDGGQELLCWFARGEVMVGGGSWLTPYNRFPWGSTIPLAAAFGDGGKNNFGPLKGGIGEALQLWEAGYGETLLRNI